MVGPFATGISCLYSYLKHRKRSTLVFEDEEFYCTGVYIEEEAQCNHLSSIK
jgi:hypothetical protein